MKLRGFLAVASVALTLPALAHADKPAKAGNKGDAAAHRRGTPERIIDPGRRDPVVVGRDRGVRCPPGLAKKSPACIPPGQARNTLVGRVLDWDDVHVIRKPGLYGLAQAPEGQRYAIVDGRLVRIDAGTAKVLSVIRGVEAILD